MSLFRGGGRPARGLCRALDLPPADENPPTPAATDRSLWSTVATDGSGCLLSVVLALAHSTCTEEGSGGGG